MSDQAFLAEQVPEHEGAMGHLDAGSVAAYLDKRLSPAETAAVEAHLAECKTCRKEIVQLESIVRPRRRGRRFYVAALAAASAAALLLIALPRALRFFGDTREVAGADSTTLRIRAMGDVAQAPIYLGVSVRAPTERGTQLFSTGMRAYTDARYTDAVTNLRGARSAGVEGPAATFFLGASHLMLGDAKSAAEEFARVIGMGETPYLAEAHYYRAKALLRLDRFAEAVTELERSIRAGNESIQTIAQSLRDSLRLLRTQ